MKNLSKFAAIVVFTSIVVFAGESYASDRTTYTAWKSGRGTSVNIPESKVRELCGDWDGCELRMSMWNWDGRRRDASRHSLFYYDYWTGNWRSSRGDKSGTTNNRTTQHVMNAWACYFTDGRYINWANIGDLNKNFALLSWNQYKATCKLTIID